MIMPVRCRSYTTSQGEGDTWTGAWHRGGSARMEEDSCCGLQRCCLAGLAAQPQTP